jgi:hypothetical protein
MIGDKEKNKDKTLQTVANSDMSDTGVTYGVALALQYAHYGEIVWDGYIDEVKDAKGNIRGYVINEKGLAFIKKGGYWKQYWKQLSYKEKFAYGKERAKIALAKTKASWGIIKIIGEVILIFAALVTIISFFRSC